MTVDATAPPKPRKGMPRLLLPILVSAGILIFIGVNLRIGEIWEKVEQLNASTVALSIGLLVANLVLGMGRLKFLLTYFGAKNVSFFECVRAHAAGLLSSVVVINLVGNVVGRFALLRRHGVDVATVTALVFTEKLLLAVSGLGLALFGFAQIFGSAELYQGLRDANLPEAVFAMCLVVGAVLVVFRWQRERSLLGRMLSGRGVSRMAAMLVLSLAAQILMAITYALVARQIIGPGAPPLLDLLAVGTVVSFAAAMPVSVNGWGVREVTSIYALGKLGVAAPEAVAASVTLGVLATVAVLLASLVLVKPPPKSPASEIEPTDAGREIRAGHVRALNTTGLVMLVAGPLTALLLFFSMHIPFDGTVISLNLGDPIALLGLVLFFLTWTTSRQLPAQLPRLFLYWIGALSLVLAIGFAIGVARFGVTEWALNNRLIGWTVILGYLSIGAMCVSHLGNHGLRRIVEVIIVGCAVITLFDLAHRQIVFATGSLDFIASNFEGFAKNRNAFALQLLIGMVGLLAYAGPLRRRMNPILLSFLLATISVGIYRTYSLSGLTCMVLLLGVAVAARLLPWRTIVLAIAWAAVLYGMVFVIGALLGSEGATRIDSPTIPEANLVVSGSTTERLLTIRTGLEMWLSRPFFGEGLGAFARLSLGENGKQLVIHSVPIWLLAEFGLVGFVVVLSLPVAVAFKFARSFSNRRPPVIGLSLGLLALFAVFGMVHDIAYQRLFWLLAGACAVAVVKLEPGHASAKSDARRKAGA